MPKSNPTKKHSPRHVRQFGRIPFVRVGSNLWHWSDLYHCLLTISWGQFLGLIAFMYLVLNTLFAIAYMIDMEGIVNAQPGSFSDAFFFSVQTMATIGYGAMYPRSLYIHLLVTIEVFLGLLGVAMATSLMFARFSRPTARVLFSKVAVICPYQGVPTLMFRVANQRNNWIVEAQVRVTILLDTETTSEGHSLRRLHELKLVRSQTPILALTWTVMHSITEDSPLYQITIEQLQQWQAQIIVTITGLDETVSQTIHSRHFYGVEDLIYNQRFVDVLYTTLDGNRAIDYRYFHDVQSLD